MLGHEFMEAVHKDNLARWREELHKIAPRSERLTWLDVFWHAGFEKKTGNRFSGIKYVWVPVERWVIYQMTNNPENVPTPFISPEDARKREAGRDDLVNRHYLELDDRSLDRNQRRIFRETGCFASPYWVIQGDRGGHKRQYDQIEARVAGLHNAPQQPPAYRELPYAEPDERTWDKLRMLDKLAKWKVCVDFADRNPDQLDAEEEAEAMEYRKMVWSWMNDRAYEATSGQRNEWRKMLEGINKPVEKDTTDYENIHREFIETAA